LLPICAAFTCTRSEGIDVLTPEPPISQGFSLTATAASSVSIPLFVISPCSLAVISQ
jgi:hypothetical protein